jgi:tetratricopeptide (TPR) repeat protein
MRATGEVMLEEKKVPETLDLLAKTREARSGRQYPRTPVHSRAHRYWFHLLSQRSLRRGTRMAQIGADAFERNGRGGTVGHTIVLSNIATTFNQMGEVLAADERYRANMLRETAAHSGPPRGRSAVNRGAVLLRLERFNEAKEMLDVGVSTAREDGSRNSEMFALVTLARMYIRRGDLVNGETTIAATSGPHFDSAPDVVRDAQKSISAVTVELELARGNLSAARSRADALLASVGYPEKKDLPLLETLLPTLSRVAMAQGDAVRAQSFAKEALSIARSVARPGGHSADVGEASLLLLEAERLGGRRLVGGDLTPAIEDLRQSLGTQHSLTREALALQSKL